MLVFGGAAHSFESRSQTLSGTEASLNLRGGQYYRIYAEGGVGAYVPLTSDLTLEALAGLGTGEQGGRGVRLSDELVEQCRVLACDDYPAETFFDYDTRLTSAFGQVNLGVRPAPGTLLGLSLRVTRTALHSFESDAPWLDPSHQALFLDPGLVVRGRLSGPVGIEVATGYRYPLRDYEAPLLGFPAGYEPDDYERSRVEQPAYVGDAFYATLRLRLELGRR